MTNLFDSTNYPETEPELLFAGNLWAWKRTDLKDYGSGYTLTYELTLESGSTPVTLTATLTNGEYIIEVSAATTAAYAVGGYQWVALITRDSDSERVRIGYGTLEVKPDPSTSTADTRSHAKIALDAIEAVLETRATQDQMSYTINGRSLERTPIKHLRELRDYYKAEVAKEEKAEAVRQGKNSGNQIKVRMR